MEAIVFKIVIAVIGSNTAMGFVVWLMQRHLVRKDRFGSTLAAVSYALLADRLERAHERGYANSEHRVDVSNLYKNYKGNGWNGDMDNRMQKFYDLPMSKRGVKK